MFKDILLPVDLDQEASWRKALPVALKACEAFGARLHVMTVVPDFGMTMVSQYFPADYEKKVMEAADRRLHAFVRQHVPAGAKVQHIIAHGVIYQEILAAGKRVQADLIVLASHRPELSDYLIGPNAARVVRHAVCSVWVVRE
jgi:nucleotide-binding universal stress UspA family protein